MNILTQEAKKKQAAVKFAIRKGKSEASRQYGVSLSSIKRWCKRYDGTFACKSFFFLLEKLLRLVSPNSSLYRTIPMYRPSAFCQMFPLSNNSRFILSFSIRFRFCLLASTKHTQAVV